MEEVRAYSQLKFSRGSESVYRLIWNNLNQKLYHFFCISFCKRKKLKEKISSLLNLTSFFRLEIFLQICTFCNGIPCPKVAFLILAKLRVDICMMAKIGFPGRRSTSRPILQASNFSTMTFTMGTISHYPKTPLSRSKVKKLSWEIFI